MTPLALEGRERPGRATELHGQALRPDVRETADRPVESAHPAGRLEAEGRGDGLLQQGASGDGRRTVVAREPGGGVGRSTQVLDDRRQRALDDQHRGRVDDVLARRATMDGRRDLRSDRGPDPPNERHDRRPGVGRLPSDRLDVQGQARCGALDRLGVLRTG